MLLLIALLSLQITVGLISLFCILKGKSKKHLEYWKFVEPNVLSFIAKLNSTDVFRWFAFFLFVCVRKVWYQLRHRIMKLPFSVF